MSAKFVIDERGNCSVCGGTHYGGSRRHCPVRPEHLEHAPPAPVPRLVVIDRTMLVSAIACNTDASPPEAGQIVNTVLYKQNGGDPNDYRDINEGMYSDRCDDNLALCQALREVFALVGEDERIGDIVDKAIREHGL